MLNNIFAMDCFIDYQYLHIIRGYTHGKTTRFMATH